MTDVLAFFLLCFTSFFTIINPLGTMPVFMTMTSSLDQEHRVKTAKKASIVSFALIIAFALLGQFLFKFFGISINSLRVVGGVIFFRMGMDMLQARLGQVKIKQSEIKTYVDDISVTPLAIPMICGPGAITNSIVLMEQAVSIYKQVALFTAITLVMVLTFGILLGSSKIIKTLGETGNNVMLRLMGLIMMVIAVEFFVGGIKPIIQSILH